jgi:hypothetical protein
MFLVSLIAALGVSACKANAKNKDAAPYPEAGQFEAGPEYEVTPSDRASVDALVFEVIKEMKDAASDMQAQAVDSAVDVGADAASDAASPDGSGVEVAVPAVDVGLEAIPVDLVSAEVQ